MHSTLTNKPGDDPHDIVVVAPDAIRVAPDDELSDLLHQAARYRSDAQIRAGSDVPTDPMVPLLDTTFRPSAVNGGTADRWPMARRAGRGLIPVLLAACVGLSAVAWKAYGEVAKKQVAKLTTQLVVLTSLRPAQSASAAQPSPPAVEADAANPASPQPTPPAESAAEVAAPAAVVPSPDPATSLQSMARDLTSLGLRVEQLKASIEQLKAGQQQASRDVAKVSEPKTSEVKTSEVKTSEVKASEQNPRPKLSALPPRPAVARPRKPAPLPPAQIAVAPALPPAAAPYPATAAYPAPAPYYASRQPDYAPYAPRLHEPQPPTSGDALTDPELSSVPRPPMPVR